jgi:predicted nucleotidyltransferase
MFADLKKLIVLFNEYHVEYLMVGGYAVNLYGYSRMTEDVDILFKPGRINGNKVVKALKEFGVDLSEISNHDFDNSTHLRLGEYPNSIDLINDTVGIDLSVIFNKGKSFLIDGIQVKVIGLDDLIANKEALNTYKDLADVEALKKLRKDKF